MSVKLLAFSLLLFFVTACTIIDFDHEMPRNLKSLKMVDSSLVGSYTLSDSIILLKDETFLNATYQSAGFPDVDSTDLVSCTVTVTKNVIVYHMVSTTIFRKTRYDSLKVANLNRKAKTSYHKDYYVFDTHSDDTLLNLSKKDQLKKYGEFYILNRCNSKKDWVVLLLLPVKQGFELRIPNKEDGEKYLNKYIVSSDIMGNIVHLSDEQFYEFLAKGGFRLSFAFKKL